ncbi:response regulator [Litorivivens sp.]|uniref:response regulator n=2 Tax=Litorivivens sp. TaxID=2020868 RepID=UPI003567EA59
MGNSGQRLNVLVADDSQGDAFIIARALSEFDSRCDVRTVGDGEALLRVLKLRPGNTDILQGKLPDIIFIDLYMPKIYGMQALQEIKQAPHLTQIPCVVMSAFSTDSDRQEADRLGAAAFIQKPESLKEFRSAITEIEHIINSTTRRHTSS